MRFSMTDDKPVEPSTSIEAYVPPTLLDTFANLTNDHTLAIEALQLGVAIENLLMAEGTLERLHAQMKANNGRLDVAVLGTLKLSEMSQALGLESIGIEGLAGTDTVEVSIESAANAIATVWQHILAWLKRVIAFVKNSWARFVNEMNDKKKLLETLKETMKQKGIGGTEPGFTVKQLNVCKMAELNSYKEAALKIARVLEGFTSVDKMASANHATELAPEFTKIGYKFTQGDTDKDRYVIVKESDMPALTNTTLQAEGWNVSNVNAVIDDAIKTCEAVKSLERVLNVFESASGLIEKNISNSKQNMENVDPKTKEGVKDAATQVNNIRLMYQVTLEALRNYVKIAVDVASTATSQDAAPAAAATATP